jgi:hypothetical protein
MGGIGNAETDRVRIPELLFRGNPTQLRAQRLGLTLQSRSTRLEKLATYAFRKIFGTQNATTCVITFTHTGGWENVRKQ